MATKKNLSQSEQLAEDFCKKYNVKISISRTKEVITKWGCCYQYRIYIRRNNEKGYCFLFEDCINNYYKNERPNKYDILSCLEKHEPEKTIWNFAREYGYSINDEKSYNHTKKIYQSVIREYKNINRIFGNDRKCFFELCEIA